MQIIEEKTIPASIAIEILEKRSKEKELNYEQKKVFDHLKKFIKVDSEKTKKFIEELKKIEKLKERHIAAILDFLPEDKEELKTVLYKDYTQLSEDEINLILEIVKKI